MELATLFKEVFDVYFDAVKENPKASNPTVKELRTKIENELSPILQKYNLQISAIRGQGILRAKPFISLLSEGQKTSQGIYLIYFFDPDNRQVEFGFGDADHKPPPDALVKSFAKNCDEMLRRVGVIPDSYNDVHYPRLVYPLSNLDNKKLESDLTKFCDVYRTLSNEFRPQISDYLKSEAPETSEFKRNDNTDGIWVIGSGGSSRKVQSFFNGSYVAIGMGDFKLGNLQDYPTIEAIHDGIQDAYTGKSVPVHDRKAIGDFLTQVKPGDVVILKDGRTTTYGIGIFNSDYYYVPSDFGHRRKVNWIKTGKWSHPDNKYHGKTLSDYTDRESELSPILKLMGVNLDQIKNNAQLLIDKSTMNQPLNQIFFGPPGTGKTYTILELTKKFTESAATSSESERIKSLVKDLPWWQIVAAVLYDQGVSNVQRIMEHPLIDAKRQFSASRSLKQNIWGLLQRQTTLDCPNVNYTSRTAPYVFFKNEDSTWRIIKETVENEAPEVIDLLNALKSKPTNETIERYRLVTFHQSYSYEDFVEGIKPTLGETDEGLSYNIVPGTFKSIATEAANDPDHNYAIFIDEINRGNIANIFGELITLIEEDKRGLEIELPYSKEKFSIPKNLYIYGTMNTADRSVEALDTALRRRFAFTEMLPNAEFINTTKCGNIDLKVLLQTINSRIEKILDRDHTIGHSYFRDIYSLNDLRHAFKSKIIPLLQEYFYNDYSKIGRILGPAFLDESTSEISLIPFGPDPATEDERPIYRFKNIDNLAEQDFTAIYTTT